MRPSYLLLGQISRRPKDYGRRLAIGELIDPINMLTDDDGVLSKLFGCVIVWHFVRIKSVGDSRLLMKGRSRGGAVSERISITP